MELPFKTLLLALGRSFSIKFKRIAPKIGLTDQTDRIEPNRFDSVRFGYPSYSVRFGFYKVFQFDFRLFRFGSILNRTDRMLTLSPPMSLSLTKKKACQIIWVWAKPTKFHGFGLFGQASCKPGPPSLVIQSDLQPKLA